MRVCHEISNVAWYIICIIPSMLLYLQEVKSNFSSFIYDNKEFLTINRRQNTVWKKSLLFSGLINYIEVELLRSYHYQSNFVFSCTKFFNNGIHVINKNRSELFSQFNISCHNTIIFHVFIYMLTCVLATWMCQVKSIDILCIKNHKSLIIFVEKLTTLVRRPWKIKKCRRWRHSTSRHGDGPDIGQNTVLRRTMVTASAD